MKGKHSKITTHALPARALSQECHTCYSASAIAAMTDKVHMILMRSTNGLARWLCLPEQSWLQQVSPETQKEQHTDVK